MRILGIDPGSTATGFGVVERVGGQLRHVAHGTLRPPRAAELSDRLSHLHAELCGVVRAHTPDLCAVERVFVAASPRSALVLGQARGVALAALGGRGLPVCELSAREVKKAVVGTGAASKAQVQAMVTRLLRLEEEPQSDAADALAIAICQAHVAPRGAQGVVVRSRRRGRLASLPAEWAKRRAT